MANRPNLFEVGGGLDTMQACPRCRQTIRVESMNDHARMRRNIYAVCGCSSRRLDVPYEDYPNFEEFMGRLMAEWPPVPLLDVAEVLVPPRNTLVAKEEKKDVVVSTGFSRVRKFRLRT